MPDSRLTRVQVAGFKTLADLDLEIAKCNILIGANGAGKSNLLSFFSLLGWLAGGRLQEFIAIQGRASALLTDSPEHTESIRTTLTFETDKGVNLYKARLAFAGGDTLVITEEAFQFNQHPWAYTDPGRLESGLEQFSNSTEPAAKTAGLIRTLLRECSVFQFHNTSFTSRMRQTWDIEDQRYLKADGGNLAPFLCGLRQNHPRHYDAIVAALREIAPFFKDFEFSPSKAGKLLLQWRERGTDRVFGAHQASDGTLRAMALIALLLQPQETMPGVMLLDEPELGLNPAAVSLIAGMLKAVSVESQIIVATQSPQLVDEFEPEDIITVDRGPAEGDPYGRHSRFTRQSSATLEPWLEEYSISDLWRKNVIGARPAL